MRYVDMKTDELQAILRRDAEKPIDEGMTYEEVRPILEVLESRKKNPEKRAEKAWENFVKFYLPTVQEQQGPN